LDRDTGNEPGAPKSALRIHQTIARDLGIAILNGRHPPGTLFEGEIESAGRLHVSRTAYREAVRILAAKGLIESRPKAGTRVTPRARWNLLDPDLLAWMFSDEPDPQFVQDLFELRGIIEPAAAELAALRRTDTHLAELSAALEQMRTHGLSTAAGRAADQRFHNAILAAAHNAALASLAGSVGAAVSWTTTFKHRKQRLPRDPIADHEAVLVAIRAADAVRARETMRALLGHALADMDLALPSR